MYWYCSSSEHLNAKKERLLLAAFQQKPSNDGAGAL
jgi:hypothetical protein